MAQLQLRGANVTHFDRQSLMGVAGRAASVIGLGAATTDAKLRVGKDIEPRGTISLLERLPTLDLESKEEFLTAFRVFLNGEFSKAAARSVDRTLTAQGVDPETEMTADRAVELLKDDPMICTRPVLQCGRSGQPPRSRGTGGAPGEDRRLPRPHRRCRVR